MSQAIHTHRYEHCGKSLNQNYQLQVHLGKQQETSHTNAGVPQDISGTRMWLLWIFLKLADVFPFISTIIPPIWP